MAMLQRESERRQQAERDAADARRDAHSTEALRTMQALQISQLNDTVAKMHAERQQYQSSSGDLVREEKGSLQWQSVGQSASQ
jgi:hypothetical protein